MIKRPKPGEDEDDLLRMQEEYLREKEKNQNLRPSAQVTSLRRSEPTKRSTTSTEGDVRKPSKYAQSKGLKGNIEKRPRSEPHPVGNILEKNVVESPQEKKSEEDDDKVYFPKVIPSLLGNIVEKNLDHAVDLDFNMPPQGFPVATKHEFSKDVQNTLSDCGPSSSNTKTATDLSESMEVEASSSKMEIPSSNLPTKSYVLSSKDANEIHNDNIKIMSKMSEKEILEEQQKLISSLDPKLVEYLKAKRKNTSSNETGSHTNEKQVSTKETSSKTEKMETGNLSQTLYENDSLWENDILSHPQLNKWLNFESFEKDKLQWMKGITQSKKVNPDEPYEARFDFRGYLLPYTIDYTEESKTLFHHGEEPHRPGYSLSELFELSRSTVTQQRVIALNTIAGILEYYNVGTYKDVIEIPLSKIFFIIRFALDENKTIILEPALRAMRNLLCNKVDEACLDALIGFEEGTQQPCLENDKSEIEELESKESEFTDFHLAEIDIIAALLRTDILQRLFYILETVRPSYNCVQYSLQILTRLARDSVETANLIVNTDHLMQTLLKNFVPDTSINFAFDPNIVYNGKPILPALKLLRVLSLQSPEVINSLVTKHDILKPVSIYISSGVDSTYGLRIQIEAYCILTNLLQYKFAYENAISLFPVIITALYKHVQGTDIFINTSVISCTHAAVVLQFINIFLNTNYIPNFNKYKQQIYPLLKEGVQKWITQVAYVENYTCGHMRILCSALDCCKTILVIENLPVNFLNSLLKNLAQSKGFKEILKQLIPSSNLLSGIENKDLHLIKNLKSLGTCVIDRSQKVLPILSTMSPLPFLASLFKFLSYIEDRTVTIVFMEKIAQYLGKLAITTPYLCDNWFTRIEMDFLFYVVYVAVQNDIPESSKDLLYAVANKLCYILRIDKKYALDYVFTRVVFNKQWFTAERLLNLVSLSDTHGFSTALTSIGHIRLCYSSVVNLNYVYTGPNIVLRKWQEPILPRDWIYLPILMQYSKSQTAEGTPTKVGLHTRDIAHAAAQKELIITCSLEWILFNEMCLSDFLKDIDVTDRFCRIMCVFLCDSSLFLDARIKILLQKCTQLLFKQKAGFDFDKQITGLNNFQDFFTQLLEQFQSVSYGDHTFAACVLVPLAQKHNVKWRKLLWSEYAGCLRALDCPENALCYDIKDYLYPEETDMSLIKSYFQALSGNLLRPGTVTHKIAQHHVEVYKNRTNT